MRNKLIQGNCLTPPPDGSGILRISGQWRWRRRRSTPRHCEERSDEAIQTVSAVGFMDCFALLAMTLDRARRANPYRPRGMQNWIASSLALLAMTSLTLRTHVN